MQCQTFFQNIMKKSLILVIKLDTCLNILYLRLSHLTVDYYGIDIDHDYKFASHLNIMPLSLVKNTLKTEENFDVTFN